MRYKIKKTRKYHDPGDPVRALEFQNRRSIVVPRIYCGDRRARFNFSIMRFQHHAQIQLVNF